MKWQILDTGRNSAEQNMHIDRDLLERLDPDGPPILHLYEWEGDCATYGYFINPFDFLSENTVKKRGLNLAQRPTGGGIIFHICDLAFSALVPASHPGCSINTLENYALINQAVINALRTVKGSSDRHLDLLKEDPIPFDCFSKQFCMAKPTKYDVIMNGRKIGGAAQRKRRQGFLHQATISIGLLSETYLEDVLLPNTRVIEAMKTHSHSLLGNTWTPSQLEDARGEVKRSLTTSIQLI